MLLTFIVKSAPHDASFQVCGQKSMLNMGSFWCQAISGVMSFMIYL